MPIPVLNIKMIEEDNVGDPNTFYLTRHEARGLHSQESGGLSRKEKLLQTFLERGEWETRGHTSDLIQKIQQRKE